VKNKKETTIFYPFNTLFIYKKKAIFFQIHYITGKYILCLYFYIISLNQLSDLYFNY